MKRILASLSAAVLLTFGNAVSQQTVAYDFNMNDCNGNMHHLFSELDSGNVVIMEYFMLSCSPCIDAGDALEPIFQNLKATCSNKIKFYHFGYTNSYNCTQIKNWVTQNGYSSIPIDSGGVQTAYYGGMGMPTVAIAAGNTHKILYTSVGFMPGDTAVVADSIRTFFGCNSTTSVSQNNAGSQVRIFPNPSSNGMISIRSEKPVSNIKVQDLTGRLIQWSELPGKSDQLQIEAEPGVYILTGKVGDQSFSKTITIIR